MRDLDAADLARKLTLADLALQPVGAGWLRPGLLGLALLGLVLPSMSRRPWFWLLLAALAGVRVISTWPLADNHAYLLAYWCLAVAIAAREPDPSPSLAWNGRVLIGLVFAFALLWKAISPDFLDGRFFRVTLVLDTRLETFAQVVGGLDADELRERRELLARHADGVTAEALVVPAESARFRTVAWLATLGTFASEALLALAFLWPLGRGPSRLRDPLLIGFCGVTYLVAPVSGFGWLLIALGVAQTEPERWRTRVAYLVVFGLVYLYGELESWAQLHTR
ncbi:MAG: hypothetical protein WEF50_05770 [Myxococcota bacterium]